MVPDESTESESFILDLINEFGNYKVKINIDKSVAFYVLTMKYQKEK